MAAKAKADLAKIGREGFNLLDDFLGSKPKPTSPPPPPQRPQQKNLFHYYQYQPQQASTVVRPQVIVSSSHQVSARREAVLDSYEAAKIYGGTLIVDYPKRERVTSYYF